MRRTASALSVIAISMFLFASFAGTGAHTDDAEDAVGSGGTGTPDTSWYDVTATSFEIGTADQLAGLSEIVNGTASGILKDSFLNKTVTLTDDVDLSAYGRGYNGGRGWVHIGDIYADAFKGMFDGAGHKITGLYINAFDSLNGYNVGLFGAVVGGTVKNIGVEGAEIHGVESIGAVAGFISLGGTVTNCYSTGVISGENYVGGITGANGVGSSVTNCYSSCNVSGNKFIGGIVGYDSDTGMTSNCYSMGIVKGVNSVGGIAGLVSSGRVVNCAALNPSVTGEENTGRVAGLITAGGVCTDNLAFAGMSKTPAKSGNNGTGITPAKISEDGTLGGRFTEAGGWTAENGSLPGLFGGTVETPEYILKWKQSFMSAYMVIAVIVVIIAAAVAVYILKTRKRN